jgi:hypothetical protein
MPCQKMAALPFLRRFHTAVAVLVPIRVVVLPGVDWGKSGRGRPDESP